MLEFVLLLIALMLFLASAGNVPARINLQSLGLALLALAMLLRTGVFLKS